VIRALICGGRDFADRPFFTGYMDAVHAQEPISLVIHGAASGADTIANDWALSRGVPIARYPAQWHLHGNRAGPMRNVHMLNDSKPDVVIAFRGGKGTSHMVRLARAAGIQTRLVGWELAR